MQSDLNQYSGACHCGNISYQLSSRLDWKKLVPRQCQCSFCMKHNNRYLSDPASRLQVTIGQQPVSYYRFGHQLADFMVCGCCGVMPMVSSVIDGRRYAVININTLEPAQEYSAVVPVDHDGEGLDTRLQQCRENWIADVTIIAEN